MIGRSVLLSSPLIHLLCALELSTAEPAAGGCAAPPPAMGANRDFFLAGGTGGAADAGFDPLDVEWVDPDEPGL